MPRSLSEPLQGIALVTINAKYSHASLALRYLFANLAPEHQAITQLHEFHLQQSVGWMAEVLLSQPVQIVGLSVYIWNAQESLALVQIIKKINPRIIIVLGGPEVSYEQASSPICQLADYVISGWGEVSLQQLIDDLKAGKRPIQSFIQGIQPPLTALKLPYEHYTQTDIANRIVYVEASRGCPYRCEFCLSSLDKTAWAFNLESFLSSMEALYQRGLRQFKFIDRTFNLNVKVTLQILTFFLEKQYEHDPVFAHFELVPDHLPEELKSLIAQFPAGTLQFEIGIQTFTPEVLATISRKMHIEKAKANIQWLSQFSQVHLHTDLIAGLPGETWESFELSFNTLWSLRPEEIQLGILKRLKGTPIIRHSESFSMVFAEQPPFEVLQTSTLSFQALQRIKRFARYWDMIANSGKYRMTLPLLLADDPFARFMQLSDYLFARTSQTHAIAQDRLMQFMYDWALGIEVDASALADGLSQDVMRTNYRGKMPFGQLSSQHLVRSPHSPVAPLCDAATSGPTRSNGLSALQDQPLANARALLGREESGRVPQSPLSAPKRQQRHLP